jgi:hypothetical protein
MPDQNREGGDHLARFVSGPMRIEIALIFSERSNKNCCAEIDSTEIFSSRNIFAFVPGRKSGALREFRWFQELSEGPNTKHPTGDFGYFGTNCLQGIFRRFGKTKASISSTSVPISVSRMT